MIHIGNFVIYKDGTVINTATSVPETDSPAGPAEASNPVDDEAHLTAMECNKESKNTRCGLWDKMQEEYRMLFKTIHGFDDEYAISEDYRIWRRRRNVSIFTRDDGQEFVTLHRRKQDHDVLVDELIATYFPATAAPWSAEFVPLRPIFEGVI